MKLFDYDRYMKPGKGVEKDEPPKPAIVRFFLTLWAKKYKLIGANLLYTGCNLLTVAFAYALFSGSVGLYSMFNPESDVLKMISENLAMRNLYFKFLLFFVILFTSVPVLALGPCQAGFTYILKSFVKGEPCFLWTDYITKTRSNFALGLKVSLINGVAGTVLMLNATAYCVIADPSNEMYNNTPWILLFLVAAVILFFAFLLTMMSMYLYPMIVTFHITMKQLYRNAFMLVMVKWLPTLLIFLLDAALIAVPLIFLPTYQYMVFVLVLLCYAAFIPGVIGLINNFFVYPILKKYMIDNAKADKSQEDGPEKPPEETVPEGSRGGRFENGRWITEEELLEQERAETAQTGGVPDGSGAGEEQNRPGE